jgi:ArsR family transcriptional regulator, arsenate/arsenite/antimonite-responsive transcriptional repressor / arsenate reductase (thioredoxin)
MNSEQTSGLFRRARMHAALADPTRLRIVDLLGLSDLSPSEVGAALDVPSNLLAHHLRVLEDAGLVQRQRSEGDRRRTYLRLTADHASLLTDATAARPAPAPRRVLFVCTANTARSHLAAALWRRASPVEATSAGTHPGERVHRGALDVARRHDLDLPDIAPRLLAETLDGDDLVITVCDRAHEEIGDLAWAHWSVPDPVPAGTRTAFEAAHDNLTARVRALVPLTTAPTP